MLNKRKKYQIKLVEHFGAMLSTRSIVSELSGLIPPTADEIVFDFSKIKFASRSFSHAFLCFKKELVCKTTTKNISKDVRGIFSLVKKSQFKKAKRELDDEITNSSISIDSHLSI